MCNVMISSAGRRVSLLRSFREALGTLGLDGRVVASDLSPLTAAGHDADELLPAPPCRSPEFIPAMLELCQRHEIALVVPTIDTELAAYAAHREAFSAIGTTVAISSPETVTIGADKIRTHRWLVEQGFPTVRQASVAEAQADAPSWDLPVIAKPVAGSASEGVRTVDDLAELDPTDEQLIVQELAPGIEHTVDAYVSASGEVLTTVPRKRLEVRAGEVAKAITVAHPELQDLVARVTARLPGAFGALNVQVFVSDERLSIIEINARFGGGFPLTWHAGARLPEWLICEAIGEQPKVAEWEPGTVMLRYDDAVFTTAANVGL